MWLTRALWSTMVVHCLWMVLLESSTEWSKARCFQKWVNWHSVYIFFAYNPSFTSFLALCTIFARQSYLTQHCQWWNEIPYWLSRSYQHCKLSSQASQNVSPQTKFCLLSACFQERLKQFNQGQIFKGFVEQECNHWQEYSCKVSSKLSSTQPVLKITRQRCRMFYDSGLLRDLQTKR